MAGNIGGYIALGPSTSPVTGVVASGAVQAGALGSGSVVSGNIASGQIGRFHIASGQLAGFELGSGSIISGRIASGQVGINHLASGTTVSASGTIQQFQMGSGAINSGHVSSGSVLGQAGGGAFTIASGSLSTYDLASGTIVRAANFLSPFQSGTGWSLNTEEIISGVRAVCISQSGQLRVAMASVSGRMPAIGVVVDNVLSGIPANVYSQGAFQVTSGMADYSGCLGRAIWVGRSGQIVTFSGSWNSGGFNVSSGGDFIQRFGVTFSSGGFVINPDISLMQNQLIGVNDLVDVVNRAFGL